MKDILEIVLNDNEIKSFLEDREISYVESEIGFGIIDNNEEQNSKILRIEYLLLNKLLSNFYTDIPKGKLFETAYSVLKSYNIYNDVVSKSFTNIFGIDDLHNDNLYFFYLASIALSSDKTIRIRLDLKEYKIQDQNIEDLNWKSRVLNKVFEAFILLVRKEGGFADIKKSIEIISQLKEDQKQFEEKYLNQLNSDQTTIDNAHYLLALYHLSKTITETADYLILGYNYKGRLESEIRIHSDLAKKLLKGHPRMQSIIEIFENNLGLLQRNSIWFSTNSIQIKKLKEFCVLKSEAEKSLLELLPSQRLALNENLLDIASNVTVIEMPTSSGKTLLAEFNIIVTKALNIDSKIVYIVPTRALVNQVYYDLKADFEGLGFSIEKTSSAIEVDPSENSLLQEKIDILVSTPEKIDLLIRRNHSSVEDVSLFIVDEAHMIQNGSRGAKLELLLSILKRERPNSKFMFLSPFLKDSANVIADWMGGSKIKTSIKINWKPAEKILIGLKQKNNFKQFSYTLLPSAYSLIQSEKVLPYVDVETPLIGKEKQKYIEFAAKEFGTDGKSILYLCAGAGTVDKQAKFLSSVSVPQNESENIKLVKKFILDEVGRETVLSQVLSKKIALHHAGLSDETKLLVEYLIREKEVKHIFATSTLAEGVNFPVSCVYFDSYKKGPKNDLSVNDFWNISGRAGRTMVDNFGKLLFPFDSTNNIQKAKSLINASSESIASVLLEFMSNADEIINLIETSEKTPIFKLAETYENSLAPLIQYLIHLLNSSGNNSYVEIEDLFKDSLGYFQLESIEQKNKFIAVCQSIYLHLNTKFNKGTLIYADKTGFSVPSVLEIMKTENKNNPSIASVESWDPLNLFNFESGFLTEKIKVIAKLKETNLGTPSKINVFNEEAVARVLIGWVKGERLFDVSSYHPTFETNKNEADRINEFIKYINSARFKASWGLSALEGIVNASENDIKENSYVPSLVYFGVDSKDSLMMRMAGIPRRLAKSLSQIIEKDETISLTKLRNRINGLTNNEWDSVIPSDSILSGMEWKRISEILVK